ncbi:related to velvet A protein [Ustilago trichophora]|uniref:Related to velvet A protein n=1 Tax=Ustilago trichophora TaxID=86804 RepID=A0A5C3DZR3_9BASI|nr:related to velvet A protein [Ustilago trichophora]
MSHLESRGNSIPPQHSTAMSKTDDSGSSTTPGAAPENSVAYQYVAVQQMTSNRDHIEYQLTVREQPKQSRMCGVGEKADRRPIDPAPIVQLRVITHDRPVRQTDTVDSASVAPPVERRPGHGPKVPKTPGVRRGLPVSTALGDGWEDKAWYLENPYFFMYAMLCNADTDEELHLLNDGKTRYTSGSCVSCLYHLKDIDGSHQGFFVFPDLSIRVEGRYRLKLCLFETIGHSVHHCKSIYSDPFHVYTAKRFPGMEESTKLSKSFAEQGLKVRVRKHPRSRRRSSKRTKDESDPSDGDAPLARERSPKRARASDILPASGLPMPQPLTTRMPRSLDARNERAEYDRKPLMVGAAAGPRDLRSGVSSRHAAAWEEEEAMRMREARGRDPPGFDHGLYARYAREERLPPSRDYIDSRYEDDYPLPLPRDRLAPPPHPSMIVSAGRGPPEYADYGRPAYHPRDDPSRPLHPPPYPRPAATPPHAHPPSLPARGHPESPSAASRNHPLAPALVPSISRPPRVHSRPYSGGLPDHPTAALHDPVRGYDEYAARRGPRYSAPYDQRDQFAPLPPAGRHSPPSPPSQPLSASGLEYDGRGAFGPPPGANQWRSGPPSPRRASEYAVAEREFAARGSSPQPTSMRGIVTPPIAFVNDNAYHRRGYPSDRPPSSYDLDAAGLPVSSRPSMRPPSSMPDPYTPREELRPSDMPPPPPSDRFGNRMIPRGERPLLPPLSASASSTPLQYDRGYPPPPERYLPPSSSGYLQQQRGGLPHDKLELADREREWERDQRLSMRQPPLRREEHPSSSSRYGGN